MDAGVWKIPTAMPRAFYILRRQEEEEEMKQDDARNVQHGDDVLDKGTQIEIVDGMRSCHRPSR